MVANLDGCGQLPQRRLASPEGVQDEGLDVGRHVLVGAVALQLLEHVLRLAGAAHSREGVAGEASAPRIQPFGAVEHAPQLEDPSALRDGLVIALQGEQRVDTHHTARREPRFHLHEGVQPREGFVVSACHEEKLSLERLGHRPAGIERARSPNPIERLFVAAQVREQWASASSKSAELGWSSTARRSSRSARS